MAGLLAAGVAVFVDEARGPRRGPPTTAITPCPSCANPLHLSSELHGRSVRCRACRSALTVVSLAGPSDTGDAEGSSDSPPSVPITPCPVCGNSLRLTLTLHGRAVQCRVCRSVLAVVAPGAPAESAGHERVIEEPVSVEPCPCCGHELRLVAGLLGCRIRCRACQSVLDVGSMPRSLCLAEASTTPPPPAASATAQAPSERSAPATPRVNGKRPTDARPEPSPHADFTPPGIGSAKTKLERPSCPRSETGPCHDLDANHELENLSRPEVLSDLDAFEVLEEADEAEKSRPRFTEWRPEAVRRRKFDGNGSASSHAPSDPVRPRSNGSAAKSRHAARDPATGRQPKRLTADASDAAARLLATGRMAARASALRPQPRPTATGSNATQSPTPADPLQVPVDQAGTSVEELKILGDELGTPTDEPEMLVDEFGVPTDPAPIQPDQPPPAAKPAATPVREPTPRRYAQSSLSGESRSGLRAILAAVLLAALGGGGWWWFSGPSAHPQAAYLPKHCRSLISLKLNEVARIGVAPTRKDLPGLMLVSRCHVFLQNAGLRFEEVERVTAGQAANGLGSVVVYHLTHPVQAEEIAHRPPFRASRKSDRPSETIRGVPVYSLGTTAVAFPEPQVIVNGELGLVREVLGRWSRGLAEPLNELLQTADLSPTSVIVSSNLSDPLVAAHLEKGGHEARKVRGSTTSFQYGQTLRLTRTVYFDDEQAASDFGTSFKRVIADVVQDEWTPKAVRDACTRIGVAAGEGKVRIEMELPKDEMGADAIVALRRLF